MVFSCLFEWQTRVVWVVSVVSRLRQAHVTLVLSALDEVKKHVEVPCSASRDELNKPRHELDIEMKGSPDLGASWPQRNTQHRPRRKP